MSSTSSRSTARGRSARRLAAAVLAAGAVVGVTALPASASAPADANSSVQKQRPPRPSVVIGRVQANSPGWDDGSNRSLNGEWVEVRNLGRNAVNLNGYSLSDRDGHRYYFDHLRLRGHDSVKVHTGVGRDGWGHVYQDRHRYVWDNYRDSATLRDGRGRVVDYVAWGRR
ncbi:lamin tail domain-containing protein [Streptomyces sp. NPDC087440]|uniref:lamin tail domain-containing protein n=1 Tax=Streptomyces sp. NPDC087440 TaxID=3365790 RepID=UPI00380CC04B